MGHRETKGADSLNQEKRRRCTQTRTRERVEVPSENGARGARHSSLGKGDGDDSSPDRAKKETPKPCLIGKGARKDLSTTKREGRGGGK